MNTNRKVTTLFIALLILAATAVSAETNIAEKIREVPNHHRLDVEIWTNRGDDARYTVGDPIEVYFRTNADAWVAIYDLDTGGHVTKLFPSSHAANNFVRGGVVHRVPSRYGHHFEVEGPSGWETLRAVASTNRRALRKYGWDGNHRSGRNDRYDDRDYRDYDDRHYDDRGYNDRGSNRPTSSPVTSVPHRIGEVPDDPPYSPIVAVDDTRHYVRDGYYRPPRPRPWWKR